MWILGCVVFRVATVDVGKGAGLWRTAVSIPHHKIINHAEPSITDESNALTETSHPSTVLTIFLSSNFTSPPQKRLHSISEHITPSHRTSQASWNDSPRASVTVAREALDGLTVHVKNWLQVDLEDRCTNQPTVTSFCLDVHRVTTPNIDITLTIHVVPLP